MRTPTCVEFSHRVLLPAQVILTQAAQGLIRGSYCGSNMFSPIEDGGEAGVPADLSGRQAALLYFDELQITDPFTAVSLKAVFEELLAEGAVLLVSKHTRCVYLCRGPRVCNAHLA